MKGDVYRLPRLKDTQGHEQAGERFCVVVQDCDLLLSTLVVCPTSTSAMPRLWRPEVTILGSATLVLTEQIRAVDAQRLTKKVATLPLSDMMTIDRAIKTVLGIY